jgi:outer membrane protein assembly factor BamB
MTLKGNLEVLNLSDIFQSLSLNQHTGTLRVTDGKREKLIYFAQGEITLLSSDKKLKIGDMLVAAAKVSQDDLEYALTQQKRTKKKLGEILVEEGFVTEDDVAEIVRAQIEEEIYDLFLWKKADFEFLIDYCPDKLKNPAHQVTKLQFNTNSLIMEALRRLDEWELISKEIPTLKEVYKVANASPAALEEIDLPDRVKAEVKLLDGERTVEAIAEETTLSEFELCKLLFELKTRKVIAPLSPQELSDRAEDCLSKGRFRQASSLYERLAEVLPKNLSIRWHLAEALKGFGDEVQALEQYEFISKKLEGTRDRGELARCYRALLELAPDRRDIAERLRAIGQLRWRQRALRVIVYSATALICATLIVLGGVKSDRLARWMDQARTLTGLGGGEEAIASRDEEKARELDGQAEGLLSQGKVRDAFEARKKIITNYPKTERAILTALPFRIDTIPTGKEIWINGIYRDRSPNVFKYIPDHDDLGKTPLKVEVRDKGRVLWTQDLDPTAFHDLRVDLFQRPIWSVPTGGAVRSKPVFAGKGKEAAMYFTSWDGYLRGIRLEDRAALLKAPLSDDIFGEDRPFGEVTSDPAVAGDLILFGTLDGKVVAYDATRRTKTFDLKISQQPLLARPAILDDGQLAAVGGNDGDITLVSLTRRAALGRSPVLCSNRVTALVATGTLLIVASRDNWVRWYDSVEKRTNGFELRGDVVTAPGFDDKVILAGDRTGKLVCLDRARGTELWEAEAGAPVTGIEMAADLAIVVIANGRVEALDRESGRVVWGPLAVEKGAGRPVASGGDVYVPTAPGPGGAAGGGTAQGYIHALEAASGNERWTAQLPAGVRGEIAIYENRLYVGCEDGNLYCFEMK